VKLAVVAPPDTVTDAGTVGAPVLLLESVTIDPINPPVGTALESVTVQVVEASAARLVLAHWRDEMAGTVTSDRFAVLLMPLHVAVMDAD
jgi:hypothetical protein